ncbi:oligopeptide transporter 4-like [Gossypium australe]|uniref:Oligopeptide transporter 4-like n=1 Tax=Gossypium australe TaxID=47621 RepID=A0A5B6X2F0_9ROSI|nr:oligopeptide transporter 4-like [Gossypium australe]
MEDSNKHLKRFLQICDTFKYNAITDNAIRLLMFPFSLIDNAFSWLDSQTPGSITTWDELVGKFLKKFFPISKMVKLRREIVTFKEFEGESFHEAWECYKTMIQRCPHHGLPKWLRLQMFYNRLDAYA